MSTSRSPDPGHPDTPPAGNTGLVYVVDDDEAVRDSMRWLLEANGFRVSSFASAEEFLACLPDPEPIACLLLDVRMPGMSGLELHEELVRRGSALPLIFITGHGDVPMAVSRMKKGAHDFLEKPFSDAQLRQLVNECLARAAAAQRELRDDRDASERIERLTGRERQVLDLIVAGRLNKQIADDLGISIKTVEAHRANIMDKLGARTMADLMRIALRAGASRAD
ncbi:MAG TPA: response regulator transcription factor [Burkholderiaceae bacterium]|nr:response regulator transcription factor [Burkholderiaceae bacterium]